jgi:hypothetical protein
MPDHDLFNQGLPNSSRYPDFQHTDLVHTLHNHHVEQLGTLRDIQAGDQDSTRSARRCVCGQGARWGKM